MVDDEDGITEDEKFVVTICFLYFFFSTPRSYIRGGYYDSVCTTIGLIFMLNLNSLTKKRSIMRGERGAREHKKI